MKTVVETYIIEETQELIYDNEKLAQWNKQVEALGLTGQTKIQVKEKSPIPFLHMKTTLVNVFSTLCPRKVDIKAYDKTPIPVEILDLAALSVREQYFNKIEIWYDDKAPDPACIGVVGEFFAYDSQWRNRQTWATEAEMTAAKLADPTNTANSGFLEKDRYLIGRWADVKMSLAQLTEKAKRLFMLTEKSDIQKRIKDEQRKMEDLERTAEEKFGFDDVVSNAPEF